MVKRIFINVHPKQGKNNTQLRDECLDALSTVKNIEKIEAQVGYTGKRKTREPNRF